MEKYSLGKRSLSLLIENKRTEQGITLLLSLLISFIMTFALSVELLNTRLNKKTLALEYQHDRLFYILEQNRKWGIQQGQVQSTTCLFSAWEPNDYPIKLKSKQIKGCMKEIGDITLHAVTEDVGIFSCHHWYRLTMLGEDKLRHHLIIQMMFTIPERALNGVCKNVLSYSNGIGQQSWRVVF